MKYPYLKAFPFALLATFLFTVAIALQACVVQEEILEPFTWKADECFEDQNYKHKTYPVPEKLKYRVQGLENFSDEHKKIIRAALQEWTDFSKTQYNYNPFTEEEDELASPITFIAKATEKAWLQMGFGSDAIGITRSYENPKIRTVEIYLDMRSNDEPQQFMNTVLHEIGHALSLGHSCAMSTTPENYTLCSPDYPNALSAVMHPQSNPKKITLRKNDKERLQCLWIKNYSYENLISF